jgi:D-3-phosphoglycerate dehydrogenase / 2-oxoglutarate reductase
LTLRALIAEPHDFSSEAVRILQTVATVELRECRRDELPRAFAEYDAVWFRLAHPITDLVLGEAPRCRVLATAVTGLAHIDLEACRRLGIQVVSLKGETAFLREVRATAELTVALALALMRRIPAAADSVLAGTWNRDEFRGAELFGKTVGIVGVGRLGSLVAGYFKAFGCRIVGYDSRTDFPEHHAQRMTTLHELLSESDIVSLHVDLNATTQNLISTRELSQMQPGSILINTSRGGVVEEAALLAALESGHLGGAALDVLADEPDITGDNPLIQFARECERVLIVPHIGGNTRESFAKTEVFLAHKVVRALQR